MLGISMVIDNPHNVGKIADILVKIQFWRKKWEKNQVLERCARGIGRFEKIRLFFYLYIYKLLFLIYLLF